MEVDFIRGLEVRLEEASDPYQRVDATNALAWEVAYFDPDRAIALCDQALALAEQLPDPPMTLGDPNLTHRGYGRGIAASWVTLGLCQDRLGNYEQAFSLSEQALTRIQSLDCLSEKAAVLYSIGVTHWNVGNFAEALDHELQSLAISRTFPSPLSAARALNVIGLIFLAIDDHKQAVTYFLESVNGFRVVNYHRGVASVLSNLCETYYLLADYAQALDCGLESLRIHQELGFFRDLGLVHRSVGLAKLAIQRTQEGLAHLQHALQLSRSAGNLIGEKFALLSLGEFFLQQNQQKEACHYLQQTLELTQRLDAKSEAFHCHELLAIVCEQQGDFQQAVWHFKQFHQLKEQVYDHLLNQKLKIHAITFQLEQAEAALQKSHDLTEALFEAIPDMILRVDRSGRYLDLKPPKNFATFHPKESYVGRTIGELYPQPEADRLMQEIEWVLQTGQVRSYEQEYLGSGEAIDEKQYRESRHVRCGSDEVLILVRDITQRKQAEAALAQINHDLQQLNITLEEQVLKRTTQLHKALELEALLKRITDKVRDSLDESQILQTVVEELMKGLGIFSCDTGIYNPELHTSTITYEHRQTGFPEALGTVFQMADYPEIYAALLTGQPLQHCWYQMPDHIRKGNYRHSILAYPLTSDQGVIGDLWLYKEKADQFDPLELRLVEQVANQCAIGIRQARLYQAAQAQVRELQTLNQLKDDFVHAVSHELRTPLSSIKMAIQLLRLTQSEGFNPKQHSYLTILEQECQREIELVNNLLDFARLESGQLELVPEAILLHSWLTKLITGFIARIRSHHIHLSWQVDPKNLKLTTDRGCLSQIMVELINNACKYTQPNGRIQIQIAPHSLTPDRAGVQLVIANTAQIPSHLLPRLFDKFYRIRELDHSNVGGTGLGLSLVRQTVELLGGELEVTSQQAWTNFRVWIPHRAPASSDFFLG